MELIVEAEVYPTESETKVRRAIENLFHGIEITREEKSGIVILRGRSNAKQSLERFYTLLRSQGILDTARSVLLANCTGGSTSFELNKQASFMGLINFSEATFEKLAKQPPLGGIKVEIVSEDIRALVDWLAPSTRGEGQ